MKGFVLRIAASAVAFVIVLELLPATLLAFEGPVVPDLVLLAAAVGVVNAVVKPVVKLLALPITLMTLGLAGLVINAALLLAVAWAARAFAGIDLSLGGFPGGGPTAETIVGAFAASIALSIVSALVGLVVRD